MKVIYENREYLSSFFWVTWSQKFFFDISGQYAFAPVAIGFFLGALFVYGADVLMTYAGINSPYDLG